MKLNENIVIEGTKICLVSYKESHVLKYHEWMKDPIIQKLTASEPLTLEKEYEMQKTWMKDDDKCVFIILNKQKFDESHNEVESMIGDVNLFLFKDEDENERVVKAGEIELMIAEQTERRGGKGYETCLAMLIYGIFHLKLERFIAKIGYDNTPSQRLFVDKFLFVELSRSEVFQEVTYQLNVNGKVKSELLHLSQHLVFKGLSGTLNADD